MLSSVRAGTGNAAGFPARAERCPADRQVRERQRPAPDPAGEKRPPWAGRALAGGCGPRLGKGQRGAVAGAMAPARMHKARRIKDFPPCRQPAPLGGSFQHPVRAAMGVRPVRTVSRAGFAGGPISWAGWGIMGKATNGFSPDVRERAVRLQAAEPGRPGDTDRQAARSRPRNGAVKPCAPVRKRRRMRADPPGNVPGAGRVRATACLTANGLPRQGGCDGTVQPHPSCRQAPRAPGKPLRVTRRGCRQAHHVSDLLKLHGKRAAFAPDHPDHP